jgi:hypothetical protein
MGLSVFQALQVASACAGHWQSNLLSKTYAFAGKKQEPFPELLAAKQKVKYEGQDWGTGVD